MILIVTNIGICNNYFKHLGKTYQQTYEKGEGMYTLLVYSLKFNFIADIWNKGRLPFKFNYLVLKIIAKA